MRGCAFHFPLVEKCLCYPIFPLLEKHSGLPFEELCNIIFLTLLSGKKCQSHFLGLDWEMQPPLDGKRQIRGPRNWRFLLETARSRMFLIRVEAQHGGLARDGGAGCRMGSVRLQLESLVRGTDLPASYRQCIERGEGKPASTGCSFGVSADTSYYHCPSQK